MNQFVAPVGLVFMCVTGVWRYMGALPYLGLIECKLNLVLSSEWKTKNDKNDKKWTTIYLEAISAKEIISREHSGSMSPLR